MSVHHAKTQPPSSRQSPPAARQRRRNTMACVASTLLHIGLFAVMFGSASGTLLAADNGGAEVDGIVVTVVPASTLAGSAAPSASGSLAPLFAETALDRPPVAFDPSQPRSDMQRLLQQVAGRQPATSHGRETSLNERRTLDGPALHSLAAAAEMPRRGARDRPLGEAPPGSTGSLWGAIAPCWRRMSGRGVPVTLEVRLDNRGELAAPPSILRSRVALDESRLLAEADALTALDSCLPRGDPRYAGMNYRLEFPAQ